MHAVISHPDHEQLFAFAESQDGYFTMAQALEAGFARSTHSYHVKAGNWLREHRGIYRLRQYPQTENGHLVLWSLWSRDRHGEPQGVYSHATALALRDLSDANPSKLHMTVPPGFRRNSETPAVLVLHKARLDPHEVIRERGYSITTAMRTISGCEKKAHSLKLPYRSKSNVQFVQAPPTTPRQAGPVIHRKCLCCRVEFDAPTRFIRLCSPCQRRSVGMD